MAHAGTDPGAWWEEEGGVGGERRDGRGKWVHLAKNVNNSKKKTQVKSKIKSYTVSVFLFFYI